MQARPVTAERCELACRMLSRAEDGQRVHGADVERRAGAGPGYIVRVYGSAGSR